MDILDDQGAVARNADGGGGALADDVLGLVVTGARPQHGYPDKPHSYHNAPKTS